MQESVIINHPPPAEKGDRNHYLGLLFYACVLRFALRRSHRKYWQWILEFFSTY